MTADPRDDPDATPDDPSDVDNDDVDDAGDDALLRALAAAPPRAVAPGVTVGRFRLGRRLGAGGFGTVYEATEAGGAGAVALKLLREDRPAWLLRFKREFRTLAGVADPSLVRLYELGVHEGRWFFTMELLDGRDLDDALRAAPDRAAALLGGLARGLVALHARGLVHRDVKPSNARVTGDGRVVLLDFGLALDAQEAAGTTTAGAGTPRYMAPEQVEGRHAGAATDWYAFGVVLHEALTGRAPFEGDGLAAAVRKAREDVTRVDAPGQPPALVDLCRRLLARDPAARPGGAEVLATLRATDDAPDAAPDAAPGPREELVGRARELGLLDAALADATARGPALVSVTGASGVGKSALVRAFVARAAQRDPALVALAGRCYAHEALPFRALDGAVDQLAAWLARAPAARREAWLPRDAALLGELFPVLRGLGGHEVLPARDPARRRRAAAAALRDLLGRVAERRPTVLVLDDVQWGDAESADLLAELLAPPGAPRLLVVTLARAGEGRAEFPARWAALRATALAGVAHADLALAPLGAPEAEALAARHVARRGLQGDHAARIAVAAEGLPFLIAMLATAARREDRTAPPLAVALARRVDGLDPDARRLLEFVCVANRATPASVLLRAARLPPDHAAPRTLCDEGLARLRRVDAGWWVEPYHDRIWEALVPMLDPARRRAIDLALAEHLAGTPGADERVAAHLLAAGERRAALDALGRAAEVARSQLAHHHAARLLGRVVALGAECGLDAAALDRVRLARAETLHDAGHNLEAAQLFAEVAPRLDPNGARAARRWAARSLVLAGKLRQGVAMLGEADASLHGVARRSMPRVLVAFALAPLHVRRIRATWERGGAPARPGEVSDLDLLADAVLGASYADARVSAACGLELLARASRRGSAAHIATALAMRAAWRCALLGERAADEARRDFALAQSVLAAAPAPVPPTVALFEGLMAFLLGRTAECAERLGPLVADESLDAQSGRMVRLFARLTWFASLYHLGHNARLAAELPETAREFAERDNGLGRVATSGFGAWIMALRGDARRALRLLDEGDAESLASGTVVNTQWGALIRFACAVVADDPAEADAAAARLRYGAGVNVGTGAGVEGRSLRARHGLYMAERDGARRAEHLRAAERAGRWLHARRGPTAQGLGAAYLAGVAASRGDGVALARWSAAALPALQAAGQEGTEMAVRHLRAAAGLDRDGATAAALARWAEAHAIGDAATMLAMFVPTLRARPRGIGG